ncbi:MAG: helix-turn-helix transcriptional regulator [Eubacteriaceae bacterium]|nr:helix-turn-helix transcriptional regulator [Eubacteriaceae bacterium]
MNTAHTVFEGFLSSSTVPLTVISAGEEKVYLPESFGTRLCAAYYSDRDSILSKCDDRDLLRLFYDRNNQLWCTINAGGYTVISGPVQSGRCLNYIYKSVREYSEAGFAGLNMELIESLRKQDSNTFFSSDMERKKLYPDEEEEGELQFHSDLFYAISSGNLKLLDSVIESTKIQAYLLEMMPDRESAEHMYISVMSQCLFYAREAIPLTRVKALYQKYFEDLKGYNNIPSILSGIFGIMHDITKIVGIQKDRGKSYEFRQTCSYIEDHIGGRISVSDIARYIGLSVSSLQHKLKNETGETVSDIIRKTRIGKACFYIENTDMPFSDITYRLGFSSQSHFINTFRDETGMTPGEYRINKRQVSV